MIPTPQFPQCKRRLAPMLLALCIDEEDYPAPKRSGLVKEWMCRKELGLQNQLFKELVVSDPADYRRLLHVSRSSLRTSRTWSRGQTTIMRQPIPLVTKMQVTLCYVASGISCPGLGSCCLTSPHCHAAPHVLLLQQVALKFYVLHVALGLFQRQSSCTLIAIYR